MITRAGGFGSGSGTGTGSGLGSDGSGPSNTDICKLIEAVIYVGVREIIPEMFESIKTELITMFDERYVVIASTTAAIANFFVVATTPPVDKKMPYREFNNTKPPKFDGVIYLIVAIRWISDV